MLLPFKRIMERGELAKEDSDQTYFMNLLYAGEMLLKISILGFISMIDENRDRYKYKHTYRIVRADSLGKWVDVLEDILSGPSAQYLRISAHEEQRELTQRNDDYSWQYQCVELINKCNNLIDKHEDNITKDKIQLKDWFHRFIKLRNRTRGHGATNVIKLRNIIV
jgi:hypothetical protein